MKTIATICSILLLSFTGKSIGTNNLTVEKDSSLVCINSAHITTYEGTQAGGVSTKSTFTLVSKTDSLRLKLLNEKSPHFEKMTLNKGEVMIISFQHYKPYRGRDIHVSYPTQHPSFYESGNIKYLTFYTYSSILPIDGLLDIQDEPLIGLFAYVLNDKEYQLAIPEYHEVNTERMP